MQKNHPLTPAPFSALLIAALCLLSPCFVPGKDDPLEPKDFSNTNSVTVLLADAEHWDGLQGDGLVFGHWHGGDGRTAITKVEGVRCACMSLSGADYPGYPKGYFYFTIDPSFKGEEVANVKIDVDYFDGFDGQLGVLSLQYDATGSGDDPNPAYKQSYRHVPLKGSAKWLKASFHLKGATFKNSESGRADFRLWASPPELCVSRVTVTLDPWEPSLQASNALAFNAAGEAKLGEWNVQWDSGSLPSFSRLPTNQKGPRWLEIRAPGTFAVGSWRTTALLEAGEYQFVGKVRTEGVENGPLATPGGVALRMSLRSAGKIVSEAPDWTTLTYDITMPALGEVELVCEFRGAQGSARFDEDSLKLIRRSKPAKAASSDGRP
jgi:hypothetical protein